jgi:hypothetical protein
MKAMSALLCASFLALVGCAAAPIGDGEPLDALERDLGGPDGVMERRRIERYFGEEPRGVVAQQPGL